MSGKIGFWPSAAVSGGGGSGVTVGAAVGVGAVAVGCATGCSVAIWLFKTSIRRVI